MPVSTRLAVALFRAYYSRRLGAWVPSKRPESRRLSWPALCTSLTRFRVVDHDDKKRLPCWSPVLYRAGGVRLARDVLELSCVVLDFDDGTELDDGRRPWGEVAHLAHTTWSHTVEAPRWRLVVPLAAPVPASQWDRVWHWAHARGGRTADARCKDPCRLYFVPAIRTADAPHEAHVHDGPLLELPAELPPTPDEVALEERRRELAARPRPAAPEDDAARRRWLADTLKTSEHARRRAAELLHAQVVGENARGVECPACRRPAVWWPLVPTGAGKALCNRRDSCGWSGWLDQLLAFHHVDLEATQ